MAKPNKTVSKAGKLLAVAFAAFKRNEVEIAKNIFALAAEEPDAPQVMGGEEPMNPEMLKAKIAKALQDGDMDTAKSCMADLEKCMQSAAVPPMVEEPVVAPVAAEDVVPVEEEIPAEGEEEKIDELPPAQLASLIKVAKKIAQAGHKDLAEKITAALTR